MDILFLVTLLGTVLVTWHIEKRRTGYRFGPMTTLISMFSVTPTLFLMPGFTILKPIPGFLGYVMYAVGVLSCVFGYAVYSSENCKRHLPLPIKAYQMILLVGIFFAVVSLLNGIYEMYKYGFFSSEITGEEAYSARANASEKEGGTISFALSALTGSFRKISGFCIVILLLYFRNGFSRPIRLLGWSTATFWVVVQFASLSRGALIWPLLTFLILIFNFNRRVPWLNILKISFLVAAILVVLSMIRQSSDEYYGRSYEYSGIESKMSFWQPNVFTWITEMIIYYQGHAFGNFGIIANNRQSFRVSFGHESLRGSSFMFRFFAPRQLYYKIVENSHVNKVSRIQHGIHRQWATWFGSLWLSYGIFGIPIVSFFTGLGFSITQRFAQQEGGVIERMYFAALTLIAFTATTHYFMGTVAGFGLFTFCSLIFIYVKFKRN